MGLKLRVDGSVWLMAALSVLLLPLNWLLGAVMAAVFHECCHLLAVWLSGGKVLRMVIHTGGAVIETAPLPPGREVVCALSGPAGSLLLLSLARWMPEMAICAGVQGAYNLLPIYPLDGGRAVCRLLEILFPGNDTESVCKWIERITLCILLGLGIYWRFWPLFIVSMTVLRAIYRKIPCKEGNLAVQ